MQLHFDSFIIYRAHMNSWGNMWHSARWLFVYRLSRHVAKLKIMQQQQKAANQWRYPYNSHKINNSHANTHIHMCVCVCVGWCACAGVGTRAILPQTVTFATALATSTAATLRHIVSLISVIMQMQSVSGIKIGFNVALGITVALSWMPTEMQLLLLQPLHVTAADNGGCQMDKNRKYNHVMCAIVCVRTWF